MKIEYQFIEEEKLEEFELANIIFNEIIKKRFITRYDINNDLVKAPLIRNFKVRNPRNLGVEMEALTMSYMVNNKSHLPLTDINLERADFGYDLISFLNKLTLTEVKSLIRIKETPEKERISLIKKSLKSNFCTQKQNSFQWLDSIKVADTSSAIIKTDVLNLLNELNKATDPQDRVITEFKKKELNMQSSLILTSEKDVEIIKDNIKSLFGAKVDFKDEKCPFCDSSNCSTPDDLKDTKVVYTVFFYVINNVFDKEKYFNQIINMIEEYDG